MCARDPDAQDCNGNVAKMHSNFQKATFECAESSFCTFLPWHTNWCVEKKQTAFFYSSCVVFFAIRILIGTIAFMSWFHHICTAKHLVATTTNSLFWRIYTVFFFISFNFFIYLVCFACKMRSTVWRCLYQQMHFISKNGCWLRL